MKPERRYRETVNKKLSKLTYYQAMDGTSTNGTPDSYYEGPSSLMWVEWKWTDSKNPRLIPDPRDLQKRWLRRAYGNNVKVAVICGSPNFGYVFPGLSWESRRIEEALLAGSKQDIADWIDEEVLKIETWTHP